VSLPLEFAPTGMQKLAHPGGEIPTSWAAASSGVCMALSSYSAVSLEDVAAQGAGNPLAIQMRVLKNRSNYVTASQESRVGFSFSCVDRAGRLIFGHLGMGYKAFACLSTLLS